MRAAGKGHVVTLTPMESAPHGMVPVPGGAFSVGIAGPVTLPDFWIDRLEVTNARVQAVRRRRRLSRSEVLEGAVPRRRARC